MSNSSWGGRFEGELDETALRFSASVDVDRRLAHEDIEGSLAHVRMLASRGILSHEDAERIVEGLRRVDAEVDRGTVEWQQQLEDVHMNIESALTERIGERGGQVHTARSRNDQIATDARLWTRRACYRTAAHMDHLMAVVALRAGDTLDLVMPGYTHLQRAQPVRTAQHLLAWAEMIERDRGRLVDAAARMNESPLGSGALATTTFPIDRDATAHALGFARPTRNSMDAVGDRDFVVETLSALANCAVHLSRIAEELVLWNTQEFGFVEMDDAFATGSSMMPQKKNPDAAELVRGKTGRVVGDLVSILVTLKSLPLAYNRDLQEDKEPLFDAFDTVDDSVHVLAGTIGTARFRGEQMRSALRKGYLEATEIADWLAARHVPFREAHHVAGRLVAQAIASDKTLPELTLEEFRQQHSAFDETIYDALDPETMTERRDVPGGPARNRVEAAINELRTRLVEREVDLDAVAREHVDRRRNDE